MRHLVVPLTAAAVLSACKPPPEGGSVELTPEFPTTLDALVAVLDPADDPNPNDDIEYLIEWERNELPYIQLDDETEVPANLTSRGDLWTVTIVATDGKERGEGEPFDASVFVVNAHPCSAKPRQPASQADRAPWTEARVPVIRTL